MNVLRALALTLEYFYSFLGFWYFCLLFQNFLQNETWDGSITQHKQHHQRVWRRKRRRRLSSSGRTTTIQTTTKRRLSSLFRETRSHRSVFRIIVSDLNFKISAPFPPKSRFSRRFTLLRARAAKEERRSLFYGIMIIVIIPFILFYTLSLSLSDETRTKNAVGIQ